MFLKFRVSSKTMKTKLFATLLVLSAMVAIIGIAPAFAQTGDVASQIISGKMGYTTTASDGSTVVVVTSHPISGQPLSIGIGFKDSSGNFVQHQNYAITVIQDGNTVLSNPTGHTHTGTDTQSTSALTSANPVNIQITLNGVGLPTADPSIWTGVKGEVLIFSQVSDVQAPVPTMAPMSNMTNATTTPAPEIGNQSGIPLGAPYVAPSNATTASNATVPEFGPVASIVLAIAVLSVVVFAAKTRIIPRF